MSDRTAAYHINTFPGNKSHGLAWTIQKRHLKEMAMIAFPNTQDGMGVLAYLIAKGKYEELYCQKHGLSPDEDGLPDVPNYKFIPIPREEDFSDSKKLKEAQANWIKETQAVQDFRAKLLASLDDIALNAVGTPDARQLKTLAEIFESLDVRFSRVTPAELGREIRRIRTPLTTIPDFEKVITTHYSLHQVCSDQNTPRSENDKIFDLQSALDNQPELQLAFTMFDLQFELSSKSRTFDEFTRQLRRAWENNKPEFPLPTTTTSTHGYSPDFKRKRDGDADPTEVEASATPSQDALNRGIEALLKLGKSLSTRPAPNNKKPRRPKFFCKVHSWCNHTTEECRDAGEELPSEKTHRYPKKGVLKNGK